MYSGLKLKCLVLQLCLFSYGAWREGNKTKGWTRCEISWIYQSVIFWLEGPFKGGKLFLTKTSFSTTAIIFITTFSMPSSNTHGKGPAPSDNYVPRIHSIVAPCKKALIMWDLLANTCYKWNWFRKMHECVHGCVGGVSDRSKDMYM